MKNNHAAQFGFINSRVIIGLAICLVGLGLLILAGLGLYPGGSAQAQGQKGNQKDISAPQVLPILGPVAQNLDLRSLPYVPSNVESEDRRLTRHPMSQVKPNGKNDPFIPVRESSAPVAMPTPILTFAGLNSTQSGCGCLPPDTHGDVGPNHYVQSVNSSIKIFDKTGTALNGTNGTTYNSFFSPLVTSGTPCGSFNNGDGFVFYDHIADRWVVSDFAFPGSLPGVGPFYQCVGVSKTSDPVAGGWWLYALQVDPANPTWIGDYPKMSLWPDAYYLSVNMFDGPSLAFTGVRVYALPRADLINGTGAPNPGAVAFTILPAGLGDSYSLVPATFRAGLAPPAGTPEYFMAIDSPAAANVVLTQVKTWRFHVDFVTPANSTFGIGVNRTPNGTTTVNGFVDAFTTTTLLVPQNGTTAKLDTLGDKLMTPLVYQNLAGAESLWVSHTVNNNQGGTGPTGIRWYQFNVTGSTIPATPVQQQTFTNATDGLWRFMPSISVDSSGNMAIGYAVSGTTSEPSIRYAGRLAGDSLNTLAQGEALMIAGGGHQTSTSGRWGDYSSLSIDPTDNATFWHTNEYFTATSSASWNTRIGKFKFPAVPQLASAVSRLTHTGVGPFDVNLPLVGTAGVEDRSASAYSIVLTFNNGPITSGTASVTAGTATPGAPVFSGNTMTVPLTGVNNAQTATLMVSNVNGLLPAASVNISFLQGDTTEDGSVNSADISQTKSQSGNLVSGSNFREDVNIDGTLNSADISLVKSKSGTALPP